MHVPSKPLLTCFGDTHTHTFDLVTINQANQIGNTSRAESIMGAITKTHAEVLKAYSSGSPNLKGLLSKAKIELTQEGLLVPSPHDAGVHPKEFTLARDILEVGAFYSLRHKDVESFDRYIGLLRVFYQDCGASLPTSKNEEALLGLSLLRLLSSNSISQFHTTLETLPSNMVANSPFLQHPVNLERWLMEGSYSKVWRARKEVPREEYGFFVDELMGTIRREIASCEEKAYDSLPLSDAATLLFFNNMHEVSAFAAERGWQINPTTQTVHFTNKADQAAKDAIPKKATITSNLQFAKELESIV